MMRAEPRLDSNERGSWPPDPDPRRMYRPVCGDAGTHALAAAVAALDDDELVEQALLLAGAARYPVLRPLIITRLRIVAVELARRLAEVTP